MEGGRGDQRSQQKGRGRNDQLQRKQGRPKGGSGRGGGGGRSQREASQRKNTPQGRGRSNRGNEQEIVPEATCDSNKRRIPPQMVRTPSMRLNEKMQRDRANNAAGNARSKPQDTPEISDDTNDPIPPQMVQMPFMRSGEKVQWDRANNAARVARSRDKDRIASRKHVPETTVDDGYEPIPSQMVQAVQTSPTMKRLVGKKMHRDRANNGGGAARSSRNKDQMASGRNVPETADDNNEPIPPQMAQTRHMRLGERMRQASSTNESDGANDGIHESECLAESLPAHTHCRDPMPTSFSTTTQPAGTTSRPGAFPVGGISSSSTRTQLDLEAPEPEVLVHATLAEDGEIVEASRLGWTMIDVKSRKFRLGVCLLIAVIAGAVIGTVLGSKKAADEAASNAEEEAKLCIVEDRTKLGDGICDRSGSYNTERCDWDGGDCKILNMFPECGIPLAESSKLGDGVCDGPPFFSEECGLDAGDCAECGAQNPDSIGNGNCDGDGSGISFPFPFHNTEECGWDGGDCLEYNRKWPNCKTDYPSHIGNGQCTNHPDVNTEDCGFDGGDCLEFNSEYPNCNVLYAYAIGDGECEESYNTEECGHDGGDCVTLEAFSEKYPNCVLSGHQKYVGDGKCENRYNNEECGFDDGDCDDFNSKYPNCQVDYPPSIGDGWCHGGAYNTEQCGWDGGDCAAFHEQFPDCHVDVPSDIGDGSCDQGEYNTEKCGWDGGDCVEVNKYPNCEISAGYSSYIGNGICERAFDTEECGFDGGDCL